MGTVNKKIVLISPKNRTVWNFRGDLIKDILARGYEVVVTGPDRTDVDKIEALGARFKEIPMEKTGTSISSDLRYCENLTRFLKQEKPDVTLGYTVKPVVYGAIAAKRAGVRNINCLILRNLYQSGDGKGNQAEGHYDEEEGLIADML